MIVNIVGTAVVIAIAVAIGLYVDKKLGVKLEKQGVDVDRRVRSPGHTAGEAPATAIRAGAAQVANLRAGQRCKECRALLESDGPDEELRYADRTLLLLAFRCPACARKRSLYVEPA